MKARHSIHSSSIHRNQHVRWFLFTWKPNRMVYDFMIFCQLNALFSGDIETKTNLKRKNRSAHCTNKLRKRVQSWMCWFAAIVFVETSTAFAIFEYEQVLGISAKQEFKEQHVKNVPVQYLYTLSFILCDLIEVTHSRPFRKSW